MGRFPMGYHPADGRLGFALTAAVAEVLGHHGFPKVMSHYPSASTDFARLDAALRWAVYGDPLPSVMSADRRLDLVAAARSAGSVPHGTVGVVDLRVMGTRHAAASAAGLLAKLFPARVSAPVPGRDGKTLIYLDDVPIGGPQ